MSCDDYSKHRIEAYDRILKTLKCIDDFENFDALPKSHKEHYHNRKWLKSFREDMIASGKAIELRSPYIKKQWNGELEFYYGYFGIIGTNILVQYTNTGHIYMYRIYHHAKSLNDKKNPKPIYFGGNSKKNPHGSCRLQKLSMTRFLSEEDVPFEAKRVFLYNHAERVVND